MNPKRRIGLLLLLIAGLVVGGFFWFDYLGLFDRQELLRRIESGLRIGDPDGEVATPLLLDNARLLKQEEALRLRQERLAADLEDLRRREIDQAAMQQALDARESEIEQREKSFNARVERYENRRMVIIQNARDLSSMRPEDAVEILQDYDDQLLIDTLRITEELAQEGGTLSLVSVWLSQLPPDRAATIQRKMTIKPTQ